MTDDVGYPPDDFDEWRSTVDKRLRLTPALVGVVEAASLFGVSVETVRRWVKVGKVKRGPSLGGREIKITREEVRRVLLGEETNQ